jgi:hypothetical protein
MFLRRTAIIESGMLLALGATGLVGGLTAFLRVDPRMQSSWLKPGAFVSLISAALIATALAYAFASLRRAAPRSAANGAEDADGRLVLLVYATVVLYAFLIPTVGYLPATALFLLTQFRLLGVESWPRNALLTIVVTLLFYGVFIHAGGMVFPQGGLFEPAP